VGLRPGRRRLAAGRLADLRGGAVRVDEYAGTFELSFVKMGGDISYVTVHGEAAIWLAEPHALTYVDSTGVVRTATTASPARPCSGRTTRRLPDRGHDLGGGRDRRAESVM